MSKVKIVQMMCASGNDYADWQYLDSEGRVWEDRGHSALDEEHSTPEKRVYKWQNNWQQIDMPVDPDSAEVKGF